MITLINSEFTINWATLVSLLIGMIMGVVLFVLIYTLVTLNKIKGTTYTVDEKTKDVTVDEVNDEITKAKKEFLIRKEEHKAIKWVDIREIVINLVHTIAKKFYPESKEPLAELTLEELILMDRYIISKVEELLDRRGFKPLQKVKLSSIIKMINAKNSVENNKVVKGVKKSGVNKIVSTAYSVLNVINPATWTKKLFVNPIINLIVKQICFSTIDIIGKETYNIYSKQAFLEPLDDSEFDELLKGLEGEEIQLVETDKIKK